MNLIVGTYIHASHAANYVFMVIIASNNSREFILSFLRNT